MREKGTEMTCRSVLCETKNYMGQKGQGCTVRHKEGKPCTMRHKEGKRCTIYMGQKGQGCTVGQ